jgi:pyruvate decarboxylase
MPLDLSSEQVDASLLDTPLDVSPKIDEAAQKEAVDAILAALDASKNPAVLVDVLTHRFNAAPEARTLVSKLRVPIYTTNMGKGIIDETEELYVGVYNGAIGTPGVQEAAETTDMMVTLGLLAADTNSGGFSRKLEEDKTIHIHPFSVVVRNSLSSPL